MDIREEAFASATRYLTVFPDEARAIEPLRQQLDDDTADVGARSNMRGHLTTSALVIDLAARKALLVHHNVYNRWLQPGGHYEHSTSDPDGLRLWLSAAREVKEETGLQEFSPVAFPSLRVSPRVTPLDIDTHAIAANPKKGEGEHRHHDFLFLALGDSRQPLRAQLDEVSGAKWVPIEQLAELGSRLRRLHQKLVTRLPQLQQ